MSPSHGYVESTVAALAPLADPTRAAAMQTYMKDVAPFLGVSSPDRRAAQRAAWRGLPLLVESDLASACDVLWDLPEREYQYAACDLIARHTALLSPDFVAGTTQTLLTTKPWWDTVDALGTVVVSPVVARNPPLVDLMWQWLDSGDRWLIRAAIQHQRGLKERTDVTRLLAMSDRFAADREFFVAKAIGWALRDVTAWDAGAVREFVADHPDLSAVARREATRGLARSDRP
jgi:3-methyladenine DNA glycosylase AlkD